MVNFLVITTPHQLAQAASEWKKAKRIAVDLECENNLHHYGTYISLVQVSAGETNWIVDILALETLGAVQEMLEDASIEKVFHDVSFDFRLLYHQFSCSPKNIFDTHIAAQLLGKEKVGLSSLLEEYFDITSNKKFQKVDWTKRPLSLPMLTYAAADTAHLLALRDELEKELRKKKRWSWMKEECNEIETVDYTFHEQEFSDISGVKSLTDEQRALFHRLFDERNILGKKLDTPVFKILGNKRMLDLVKNSPRGVKGWKSLRRIHPIIRKEAEHFADIVKEMKGKEEVMPKKQLQKLTREQGEKLKLLKERRNEIAQTLGIAGHILISTDHLREIIIRGDLKCLKKWQQVVLNKQLRDLL